MDFLMEAVVISFIIGAIAGAVVAMHLSHPKKAKAGDAKEVLEP